MYLSRVELDPSRRNTMIALAAPQKFHGALESSFPGERQRRLWRLDYLGNRLYMLILSEERPDLSNVINQFGTGKEAESRSYDTLLQTIAPDSYWHFRLVANPTKSCKKTANPSERGTVVAHRTVKFQKKWLLDRAKKNGFEIEAEMFDVKGLCWKHFTKSNKCTVSLLAVTYEGTLKVTDVEKFQSVLCNGIGRGKAYGMGMLTVVQSGVYYE